MINNRNKKSVSLIPQSLKSWGTPISWKQCLAHREGETGRRWRGKWIKQKHDEKQKERERERKKTHQLTDFEIASCQLCLLYFTSHYVAGLFFLGDGCLSAAVTGITITACLYFYFICREKDTREVVLRTACDMNTDEVSHGEDLNQKNRHSAIPLSSRCSTAQDSWCCSVEVTVWSKCCSVTLSGV